MYTLTAPWRRPRWPVLLLAAALLGACTNHQDTSGPESPGGGIGYDSDSLPDAGAAQDGAWTGGPDMVPPDAAGPIASDADVTAPGGPDAAGDTGPGGDAAPTTDTGPPDVSAPPADVAADSSGACAPNVDGANDATITAHTLPAALPCGVQVTATVTVRNTGSTTWSRPLGFRLGTNEDEDPLFQGGTRVDFPDDSVCVPPGGEYAFAIPLQAPGAAGDFTTDWRMVLEGVEWFGDVASQQVAVTCAAPGDDQIDLTTAVVVKGAPGIAQWPVTAELTDVSVAAEELCTWHTKAGQWPTVPFFDDPENPIEGNQWLFANIGGTWYGGAGEWLRPAQQCKIVNSANIGPDEFYNDNEEPLHSWVPTQGELVGVMVSTPARAWPAMATLDERSNVVLVPWSW